MGSGQVMPAIDGRNIWATYGPSMLQSGVELCWVQYPCDICWVINAHEVAYGP